MASNSRNEDIFRPNIKKENIFDCSKALKLYKCQKCIDFETYSLAHLKRHVIEGHSPPSLQEEALHQCPICNFETFSKYLAVRHKMLSKCAAKIQEQKNGSKIVNKKSITSKWFDCGQCLSKFKRKGHLRQHILARHTAPENIKWFKCDQCPFQGKRKEALKEHKMIHSKPEDIHWFECHQCLLKFKHKKNLNRHIIVRHKPEKIKWFKCDECTFQTKIKANLKSHKISRHKKPEDIHWRECDQCVSKCNQI